MKILLANHWLRKAAGSETFTYTLAHELKRLGHKISVFTFVQGLVSKKIEELGIKVYNDKNVNKLKTPDLILASHYTTVVLLRSKYPNIKIIQTIHGLVPKLEAPVSADRHVVISEEILRHYGIANYKKITNGIDLERFKIKGKLNINVKNILLLSNRWKQDSKSFEILKKACKKMKLNLRVIKPNTWNVEDEINKADLVVTMGRGAMEAAACDRNVVVAGYDRLVGHLNDKNYEDHLTYNLAARDFHEKLSVQGLIDSFSKYDPMLNMRGFAEHYHDIKEKAEEYLAL